MTTKVEAKLNPERDQLFWAVSQPTDVYPESAGVDPKTATTSLELTS